jgi:hypothetical protein
MVVTLTKAERSPPQQRAYGVGVIFFSDASSRRIASADFSRTPEWLAW